MSAELASYGGGVAAAHGALGFEPPLSPPNAGSNENSMTTNVHGYLGLVPGGTDQPEPPAPSLAPATALHGTSTLESLLLRFGLVSSDQLGEALREQTETGRPVGAIVVERGWVSAADVERLTGAAVAPVADAEPAPTPAPFPPVPAFEELPEPPAPVFHIVEAAEPAPEPAPLVVAPVAPAPEPEPEPPVSPIVPFHGTFTPMDEPDAETEPEPAPAALISAAPAALQPPAPVLAPVPPAAPAAEPVAAPFAVEREPTPPAVPLAARVGASPDQPRVKHVVIARLTTGERVEVNSYADRNAARAEAKALMAYLREGHKDWPFVHGRFIRPESIVSIDLETVLLG